MDTFRLVVSVVLALAMVAGAAAHGARAAAMAMPMALVWSADSAEPCALCDGQAEAQGAAHCALTCAGLNAMISDPAALPEQVPDHPLPGAPAPIAGHFADPEPDPPR